MAEKLTIKSELTIREKAALFVLLLILRIIKPFEWQHETDKYIKELEEIIKQ